MGGLVESWMDGLVDWWINGLLDCWLGGLLESVWEPETEGTVREGEDKVGEDSWMGGSVDSWITGLLRPRTMRVGEF